MDQVPQSTLSIKPKLHNWVFLILLIAVCCAYMGATQGGFYLDDYVAVEHHAGIRSLSDSLSHALITDRGPVALSFAINYAIGQLDPFGYHLVNVLIHWLNGVMLYALFVRVLLSQRIGWEAGRAVRLALCASLLWLMHPLATQPVLYVCQRSELMMAGFFMASLYALIRSDQSEHRSRIWQVLAVLFCFLAILCKLVAFTLPIVGLLFDRLLLADSFKDVWRRRKWMHMGMFACWMMLWVIGFLGLFNTTSNSSSAGLGIVTVIGPFEYLTVQSGVILHYLKLSFWPSQLVFDYSWPPPNSFMQYAAAFGVLTMLFVLTVGLVIKSVRWSILPMSFFLILAPTSSLMPILDLAVEHRMYLPLACVCVGVSLLLNRVCGRKHRLVLMLLISLSVLLGIRTAVRVQDYRNALTLWRSVLQVVPNAPRARLHYAQALVDAKRIDQAIEQFSVGIKLHPKDSRFYHNLGQLYLELGQLAQAREMLETAVEMLPQDPVYWFNLAKLDRLEGRIDQARQGYEQALKRKPDHVGALSDMAEILALYGQWDASLKRLDQAQALEPDKVMLQINRANILLRAGRPEAALIAAHKAVVTMKSNDPSALTVLASAYAANGQWAQARDVFAQLVKQTPSNPGNVQRLAWLLATCPDPAVGDGQQALALAKQFLQMTGPQNPIAWDTLAAALAHCREYDQAVKAIDQGIDILKTAGHEKMVQSYQQRRALYAQDKPYQLDP